MKRVLSGESAVVLETANRRSIGQPTSEVEEAWATRQFVSVGKLVPDAPSRMRFLAHRAVSLRILLIFVGCLFVVSCGLIVFGICYAAGTASVRLVETDLQGTIADSIVRELTNWLTRSYHGVNEFAEQLRFSASFGLINLTESSSAMIRRINLPIVRQFVPSLYLGFKTGYFVGFNNLGSVNGSFILTESVSGAPIRSRFFTDAFGAPLLMMANSTSVFNATLRPWYQASATAQLPLFTAVYSFVNVRALGITVTMPLFEDLQPPPFFPLSPPSDVRATAPIPNPRVVAGVIGADISLLYLNDFLSSLQYGKTGEAFVIDSMGYFIGTSQVARIGSNFTVEYTHSTRIDDPLINVTLETLISTPQLSPFNRNNFSEYSRFRNISNVPVSFNSGYSCSVTSFSAVQWSVVVLIPRSDYLQPAENRFFISLYVALGIVALATVGFFIFGMVVTKPIAGIARSMEIITKELVFDDDFFAGGSSHLVEIDSMLDSFSRLKYGLQSFSRYVPLSVVRTLMNSNSSAVLGVDSCVSTLFFSDIESFTSICETQPPAVLLAVLEDYFTKVSELIFKTQGLLIDFVGDAVLASWNAPLEIQNHEYWAVKSALMQQKALEKLRVSWKERGLPELNVRMGLTTGIVLAGNVGSKLRMKYTLLGDSVNLAARLEALNKLYGTRIMISGNLHDIVHHHFICKQLDLVTVVGREQRTFVYEVLMERSDSGSPLAVGEEECLRIELLSQKAFAAFRIRNWDLAREMYSDLGGKHGQLMIDRINEFEASPPPDNWDGLTIMNTK